MSEQQQLDREADNAIDKYQAQWLRDEARRIRNERRWRIFDASVGVFIVALIVGIAAIILGLSR